MGEEPGDSAIPALSVVVPVYQESQRIGPSLRRMCAYLGERHPDCEIILVDDGSTDGTCAAIEAVTSTLPTPIRLLRYESNRGKGHALKVGFACSRGRRVLFSDADLSTPIEELEKLLPVLDAGNPIAVGSRKMAGAAIEVHQNPFREWLGKGFTLLVNIAIADVSDATCGFKLFDGDVGRELFSLTRIDDWTFDAEVLFLATRNGHAIVEIPVRWSDAAGTKVRLGRDVLNSAVGILRIRALSLAGAYRRPEVRRFETQVSSKLLAGAQRP